MEMKSTNGTENRKKAKIAARLVQPLLIAACLFLWLVFTPMGQLVHVVVWWKTVSVQEANWYCGIFSVVAGLLGLVLSRRSPKVNG